MQALADWLEREISGIGDGEVLLLSPHWRPAAPRCRLTALADAGALGSLPAREHPFDLAVAVDVLEHLDADEGGALLAALRDLEARRLLVAVPAHPDPQRDRSTWGLEQMLAHGLEARAEARHRGAAVRVYGFDIARYKRTPDWLNPRHWANPELWGKHRW